MGHFPNPESLVLKHDARMEMPESERALYDILVPENQSKAIELDEFAGLYSSKVIAEDKAYVQERISQFEAKDDPELKFHRMQDELFEAIINSQIAESDWMGPRADVIVPSRYDDIKNGVDSIVEFDREEGGSTHLALAIDVTEGEGRMEKKFNRIKESIKEGDLSKIKYFKSDTFRGEISLVPRVVIGASHETIKDVTDLLIRFRRLRHVIAESRKKDADIVSADKSAKELAEVRNRIAAHPMQAMILAEIKQELKSFSRFARRIGKNNIADRYTEVLALIDGVLAEKGEAANLTEELENDRVYKMIMEKAALFEK